jgi:hypothetical protein
VPDDRFKPPQSPVDVTRAPDERAPVSVRNACALILIALVLGYGTLLPGIRAPQPEMSMGLFLFEAVWVIFFSWLTYWLTRLLRRRSNAARWATLVLLAIGWALMLATLQDEFNRSPMYVVIQVAASAIEAVAIWLLFTGVGAKWFARGAPK